MNRFKTNFYYVFLLVLIVFHSYNNYLIITADECPMLGDQLSNYEKSINFYKILTFKESFTDNYLKENYGLRGVYPPLIYLNTFLFYLFLPLTYKTALLSNITFLIILVFFSFKLTAWLSDKLTALFAASLISFLPGIYRFSRVYFPVSALTAITIMSVYLLFKTNFFSNRKYSLWLGLGLGLGMLAKQSFLFAFLPLALLTACKAKFKDYPNIGLCLGLAIVTAGPWYFFNLSATGFPSWALSADFSYLKLKKFLITFLNIFPLFSLGKIFYLSFLIVVPCFMFFTKQARKTEILTWLLGPLILYYFLSETVYNAKYLLPLIPAGGLMTALILSSFKLNRLKFVIINFLILFLAVSNYLITSYPQKEVYFTGNPYADIDKRNMYTGLISGKKYSSDIQPLADLLKKHFPEEHKPYKILALFDTLDYECIRFEILSKNPPLAIGNMLPEKIKQDPQLNLKQALSAYHIILFKQAALSFRKKEGFYDENLRAEALYITREIKNNNREFKHRGELKLKFGSREYIYEVYVPEKIT